MTRLLSETKQRCLTQLYDSQSPFTLLAYNKNKVDVLGYKNKVDVLAYKNKVDV